MLASGADGRKSLCICTYICIICIYIIYILYLLVICDFFFLPLSSLILLNVLQRWLPKLLKWYISSGDTSASHNISFTERSWLKATVLQTLCRDLSYSVGDAVRCRYSSMMSTLANSVTFFIYPVGDFFFNNMLFSYDIYAVACSQCYSAERLASAARSCNLLQNIMSHVEHTTS